MATRIMKFSIFTCLLMWLLSFAYADSDRHTATVDTVGRHWVDALVDDLRAERAGEAVRAQAAVSATWRKQPAQASDAPFQRSN